jgi:hypothetical protein
MRNNRIATSSSLWGLSATTRHQKRGLFLWNLSQRENLRVVSGGSLREEVCTLYRWGRGYGACSRKTQFWFLAWWLGGRAVLWRVAAEPLNVCIAWWCESKWTVCQYRVFYIVTCTSAVWPVIELSRPYLYIPEIKDSCEHKGVVQSAYDTDRVELWNWNMLEL